MLLIIIWYFFHIFGLGLGLEVSASFNITGYHCISYADQRKLNWREKPT